MKSKSIQHLIATLSISLGLSFAQGATIKFTGADNGTWETNTNWDGGSAPGSTDIASIDGNSGSPSVVDSIFDIGRVTFSGSTAKTISINSGKALVLHGTGTPAVLIDNAGNQNLTINGTGEIRLANSGNINVAQSVRTLSLQSKITETGGARQIIKTGDGTLALVSNTSGSTFSGGIRLSGGTLSTNASSTGTANNPTLGPLGTGTLVLESGTFTYTGTNADGTFHNKVSITGNVTLGENASGRRNFTFAGDTDLNGVQRTLTVNLNNPDTAGRTVTFSGVVSNGGITKTGNGILRFLGNNTYTGKTTIENGTLLLASDGAISSSSQIEIKSGATLDISNNYALANGQVLTGKGSIINRFRIGGGVVNPGTDGLGKLTIVGNASTGNNIFLDGGTIRFGLANTDHAQLIFSGDSFALNGNTSQAITISLFDAGDGTPLANGEYLLISTDAMTNGTFNNWGLSAFTLDTLPSGLNGSLVFKNNNLYFNVIPEPQSAVLILLAAAGLCLFTRRRASV